MTVYSGRRIQRGHGLGNIFGSLFRSVALPLVKRTVVPALKKAAITGVKHVGRRVAQTGLDIASDVISGKKPSQAVKERASKTGRQLLLEARQRLLQSGKAPKRKPVRRKTNPTRKRRRVQHDIFSQ